MFATDVQHGLLCLPCFHPHCWNLTLTKKQISINNKWALKMMHNSYHWLYPQQLCCHTILLLKRADGLIIHFKVCITLTNDILSWLSRTQHENLRTSYFLNTDKQNNIIHVTKIWNSQQHYLSITLCTWNTWNWLGTGSVSILWLFFVTTRHEVNLLDRRSLWYSELLF